MVNLLFVVTLILFSPFVSAAQMLKLNIQVDGLERTAEFFQPHQIKPNGALLVVLHGGGGDSKGMARVSGFNQIAENEGFSVLYPQGIDKHWNDGRSSANQSVNDVNFINQLVKKVIAESTIHPSKVFGVGISNGGLMMQRLACESTTLFKAIATIAATMTQSTYKTCQPSALISVLTIHGTKDKIIPYEGGKVPIGQKGAVVSTQSVLEFWRKHNHCSADLFENNIENAAKDWTQTTFQEYLGCQKAKLIHYKVRNGGHTWPSSPVWQPIVLQGLTSKDFNASLHIWRFFQSLDGIN